MENLKRKYWVRYGFSYILDGIITLVTFGHVQSSFGIRVVEARLMNAMRAISSRRVSDR